MDRPPNRPATKRAQHTFWFLIVVAVASAGSLTASLRAPVGPVTGVRVAVSGLVLVGSITLAARILIALERARRRP